MNLLRLINAVLILTVLGSCSTTDPHINFKQMLFGSIGENIDEQTSPGRWVGNRKTIKEEKLLNGNIERTYLFFNGKSCEYALEFNPVSRKIVNARIVQGEHDCYITP